MKVLIVNTVCGSGSTGKICVELAKKIINSGNECLIAFGRGKNDCKFETLKISNSINVHYNAIQTRLTDRVCEGSSLATKKFIKEIDIWKPDLIHLHNLHGYYLNIQILFEYLKVKDIPVVWTLHDCWAFTGHCVHFEYNNCYKWQAGCHDCMFINTYPKSYVDNSENNYLIKKQAFNSVNNINIITPSNWLKKYVESSFLNKFNVKTINNGIDMSKFTIQDKNKIRKLMGIDLNKKIVLGIANPFGKSKGFYDFLKLANMLSNYIFILVGLNKKQLSRLPSNIIGINKTTNIEKLINIYNCADIFLNPTYEDNFPTVNLEAQACGIPVICYNTGGCKETLNQEFSQVVKTGDIDKLSVILLNEKELSPSKRIELSKWTKEKFDNYKMVEKYYNTYKEVMEKNIKE